MTNKEILEIIDRFEGSDITWLKIKEKDTTLELEKCVGEKTISSAESAYKTGEVTIEAAGKETQKTAVRSPLAGVFYSAPKPGAESYVTEGKHVKKGDVLGLVEAMKMMNEIIAPADGIVAEINAVNEAFVQFDEIIMTIT